jgi:hypothetical protein
MHPLSLVIDSYGVSLEHQRALCSSGRALVQGFVSPCSMFPPQPAHLCVDFGCLRTPLVYKAVLHRHKNSGDIEQCLFSDALAIGLCGILAGPEY